MLADAGKAFAPWIENPYRLISWWDMEKFSAEEFYKIARLLAILERETETYQGLTQTISQIGRKFFTKHLRPMTEACDEIGLDYAVKHIKYLRRRLHTGITFQETREYVSSVSRQIMFEMQGQLFLHVPVTDASYYNQVKPLFGKKVADRFPSCSYDIEECGKCFATGRYTAVVLHSMRVLEVGLRSLACALRVPFEQSGWDGVLNKLESKWRKIEARRRKPPNWRKERQFYSEAFVEFRYFKDAWRNYAAHAHASYGSERAKVILDHVESFMRHLSTKLKES